VQTRPLGTSDMAITPIGLGAWAIGGPGYAFGWGPQDDEASIRAIHRALDLGINWIDTAPVYGLGHSEEVVARALKAKKPGERPYVFTKCSLVWDDSGRIGHSLKADSLRREVEASLRRLDIARIDLYQVHWATFQGGDQNAPDLEEGWRALVEMQREGKLRHLGVSNFNVAQLERISRIARPVSLQPSYALITRGVEVEILPWCLAHQVGVIVYSPMASGLLSGTMTRERVAALPADDWRKRFGPEFRDPNLTKHLELVETLRAIGARHGKSPGEVAIAWTLRHPAVTGAIVGARNAEQVDGFIDAAEWRLAEEEIAEIAAKLE